MSDGDAAEIVESGSDGEGGATNEEASTDASGEASTDASSTDAGDAGRRELDSPPRVAGARGGWRTKR